MQGAWIWSLVRELRSHMSANVGEKNTWKVQGRQMDFNKIELTEMEIPTTTHLD